MLVDRDASTVRVVRDGATQPGPTVPIRPDADVQVRGDDVLIVDAGADFRLKDKAGAWVSGKPAPSAAP